MLPVFLKEKQMAKRKVVKKENVQVKILKPVAGRFGLSATLQSIITINHNQASEMVEDGYAEYIK